MRRRVVTAGMPIAGFVRDFEQAPDLPLQAFEDGLQVILKMIALWCEVQRPGGEFVKRTDVSLVLIERRGGFGQQLLQEILNQRIGVRNGTGAVTRLDLAPRLVDVLDDRRLTKLYQRGRLDD